MGIACHLSFRVVHVVTLDARWVARYAKYTIVYPEDATLENRRFCGFCCTRDSREFIESEKLHNLFIEFNIAESNGLGSAHNLNSHCFINHRTNHIVHCIPKSHDVKNLVGSNYIEKISL